MPSSPLVEANFTHYAIGRELGVGTLVPFHGSQRGIDAPPSKFLTYDLVAAIRRKRRKKVPSERATSQLILIAIVDRVLLEIELLRRAMPLSLAAL